MNLKLVLYKVTELYTQHVCVAREETPNVARFTYRVPHKIWFKK